MRIEVTETYDELSEKAAKHFCELVSGNAVNVVLATGNTPIGMYNVVTRLIRAKDMDVSRMTVFQLDGYLGLSHDDPRSLSKWCRKTAVEPWGIPGSRFIEMSETTDDYELECQRYASVVEMNGGFDVAILGLGPNGHLGFNEPPSSVNAPTRTVELTLESRISNGRYWGDRDDVPCLALTAGMDLLMQSRHVLLLVSGENKSSILEKTISGPVTDLIPASHLQRHPSVTVWVDRAAYSGTNTVPT